MSKRVLFLSNHFITLFSFRKELIKRLVEEGNEVILSLPEDPDNQYFSDMGCRIVITPIDRHGLNPIKDIRLIGFYRNLISECQPDIIFSYTIKSNIYGCLAHGKKYKQICNITGTGSVFLQNNAVSAICKLLYRISVRNCYKVFFQNTGDRDFFINHGMVRENYEMLPGSGCNLTEHTFQPMPEDPVTRFIFIGRVMKLKGIDEYLEAARMVKEKRPDTEFLIAGWNEEKEYIKIVASYQEQGIVHYIGFRRDIKEWIEKCNCTVLPSHGGEGIPNVLLESAATGRACIASDICGSKDVIDDGVNGYLFEKGNAAALAEKMNVFIGLSPEERAQMGKAGREKVEKFFDREFVVNCYCKEVENSCAGSAV